MEIRLRGKGAMVWQLRMWQGGDPAKQVAEAIRLGLAWVSIKVTDGCRFRWEGGSTTNADLMAKTAAALRAAGIQAYGWGWLWGNKVLWDYDKRFYVSSTPKKEAEAAAQACQKYGLTHFQVDAEAQYRKQPAWAEQYCVTLNNLAPAVEYSLCSYRYPITAQPDFPTTTFAPQMDAWSPQVYFLLDNRVTGGATQLAESFRQYRIINSLPLVPIAPTYPYGYKDSAGVRHEWRATKAQLLAFFQKAKDLGCPGVGVWDLPQASLEQKAALAEFTMAAGAPPPPVEPPPSEAFYLAWPVPAPKVVTQAYGIHPEWYKPFGLPGHEGLDLRAVNGTPVHAMADGQVIRVEPNKDSGPYGVQVRIEHKHPSGIYETVHAHFTVGSIKVVLGQMVKRGDLIGLADNTGNSSGAHLHITLKKRGHGSPWMNKSDIVDPTPYMPDLFPGKGWIVDVASNLRTGAGFSSPSVPAFPVIRLLQPNTVVEALEAGLGEGDWWKVRAGSDVGFIWQPGYKLRRIE